ncbi:MAG: type II/IV secretion system protein [Parcubacteria group bacterium]|nr:type II/IV secretion system protein [Parcubacteria group bacterium]
MVTFDENRQNKQLEILRRSEEEDVVKILSQKYGIPYLDLGSIPINTDALRLIPEEESREAEAAGFKLVGKKIFVAVLSPKKERTLMALKELERKGYEPLLNLVSRQGLERAWERYKEISFAEETEAGVLEISSQKLSSFVEELGTIEDLKKLITETMGSSTKYHVSHILEILIAGGMATEASDIHIEPEETSAKLRLRLDGVLQDLMFIESKIYTLINSRIKLLSGLKLNVKDEAQDGRFSIKIKDNDIEIRTSIIPGAYGESIVMRLLNPKKLSVSFENLGIEPRLLSIIERELEKPNGMILNTGPTGSGKTTALYAFLKKVQTPGIKIITIEDPVEYHLPGITQTQVDEEGEYTFAQGVRSVLRQDPDVIMIGEIRDKDTARTAIHAALTGHLVLATLHTNNAAGTIPRLIDLGVNSKVIGSALTATMAQRLVRKICLECKKKRAPTAAEKKIIQTIISRMPDIYKQEMPKTYSLWEGEKCLKCHNTGYKGRIGIFEAILMDEQVEKVTTQNPSEREITKAAESQNILSMREDGLLKVMRGITSLSELERVVGLEGD